MIYSYHLLYNDVQVRNGRAVDYFNHKSHGEGCHGSWVKELTESLWSISDFNSYKYSAISSLPL